MMKSIKSFISFTVLVALFVTQGCESILEEPVHSQFAESNLLTTKQGLESVLVDAYAKMNAVLPTRNIVHRELTTDLLWAKGGGFEGNATPLMQFRWDPSNSMESIDWLVYWQIIRNANIILENLENVMDFNNEEEEEQLRAESRFMRSWAYYQLWDQFGPIPIRRSQNDPLELARATDEEFRNFLESELLEIIPGLPIPGNEPAYGRVHSEAARGLLCKWYLNTYQWQNCASVAQDIISNGYFELYPDYNALFALENEQNSEFMLVNTKLANIVGNALMACLLPSIPSMYRMGLDGGINGVVNEKWANFAANYLLYDDFYFSFEPDDQRKNRILTRYINTKGDTINLLDYENYIRGMKFPPDPDANGNVHGNDVPMIRYADILLSRAEALNELNGPNQESIDLINQVRTRAGLNNLQIADFVTKEELRLHLLQERAWEFWLEGKRRRDLIRMGKYIEYALARGMSAATENHVWFPIPQSAIDANPLLEQNTGF